MSKQQKMPIDTRAAFLSAMSKLQADFADAAAAIDAREATLKTALSNVPRLLNNGFGETVLSPTHPLALFITDFNAELAHVVQDWLDLIEKHDRNTAFRAGLTDSLVVYVLGKVKAGKSSLGNYIAYGMSNPVGLSPAAMPPCFFTAAVAAGEAEQAEAAVGQGGYFRVGANETTKSIQGFRLPGLTWVDSPGLHSVTRQNGALAASYADVADLIVYPMSSGAPGRAGDFDEIRKLLRAKKRLLIMITQCDKLEEDEDSDGLITQRWVMKDTQTRQGQIDYVRGAITKGSDDLVVRI